MGQAAATCVAGTVGIVEDENPAENPENPENLITLMLPLIADSSVMLIHANQIAKKHWKDTSKLGPGTPK